MNVRTLLLFPVCVVFALVAIDMHTQKNTWNCILFTLSANIYVWARQLFEVYLLRTCLFVCLLALPFQVLLCHRSLSFRPTHLGQLTDALLSLFLFFGLHLALSFVVALCFALVNRASRQFYWFFFLSRVCYALSLSAHHPFRPPADRSKLKIFTGTFAAYSAYSSLTITIRR